MIRVFIAYRDRDAALFFINHDTTIETVKNKFFGPYPVIFQTTEGPITIEWGSFEKVYIQEWEHERTVGEVVEVKSESIEQYVLPRVPVIEIVEEEKSMTDEEVAQYAKKATEEVQLDPQTSGGDSTPSTEPSVEPAPESTPEQEVIQEDKQVAVDAKILNEKFVSFRQKFIDLENSQETWENQIIEKMAARETLLKTFADTIDEENTALDVFKTDKVGS